MRPKSAPRLFDDYGHFMGRIPKDCVKDCTHQGECFEDIEHWQSKLAFDVPRDKAIKWLESFGAWPLDTDKYDTGLNDMTDLDLSQKVLWLACCEIKESGEWYGLVE